MGWSRGVCFVLADRYLADGDAPRGNPSRRQWAVGAGAVMWIFRKFLVARILMTLAWRYVSEIGLALIRAALGKKK